MTDTTAQEARAHAADLADKAKDSVNENVEAKAEELRKTAADKAEQTAKAAENAADTFDAGSVQAQAAAHVADTLEGVAAQVRETDLNRMAANVSKFARQNPAIFIGGAALLGFAATRFLKAREPEHIPAWSINEDPKDKPDPNVTNWGGS